VLVLEPAALNRLSALVVELQKRVIAGMLNSSVVAPTFNVGVYRYVRVGAYRSLDREAPGSKSSRSTVITRPTHINPSDA